MRNLDEKTDEKKAAPAGSEREQPMEERLKEVEKRLSWTSWAIVILGALNTINCLYLGHRISQIVTSIWGDAGLMEKVVTALKMLIGKPV